MAVLLVHHGAALAPDVDSMRPLSSEGRAAVARLAEAAAGRGLRPDAIWHSGKLRARQTAEAFRRACNPLAQFSAARGLQPGDPPSWMRDTLTGESRTIVVVGHMPHLPRLLHVMLRLPDDRSPEFPLHGCVALEIERDGWREAWRLG